jgi:hypothetical protein
VTILHLVSYPALLDKDADRWTRNPRGGELDKSIPFLDIGRHSKVHLAAIDRARIADRGEDFRSLSVEGHCERRIDIDQGVRWKWKPKIHFRNCRTEAGGK